MTGTTEGEAGQEESLRSSQCISRTGGGKGTPARATLVLSPLPKALSGMEEEDSSQPGENIPFTWEGVTTGTLEKNEAYSLKAGHSRRTHTWRGPWMSPGWSFGSGSSQFHFPQGHWLGSAGFYYFLIRKNF